MQMITAALLTATFQEPPQNPAWLDALIRIDKAPIAHYNLKNTKGETLDCLKVQQTADGSYLGLSHNLENDVFHLTLTESTDLKAWKPVARLDSHAHQPTFEIGPQGQVFAAWEKDVPGKGNHIHLAYYPSIQAFKSGKASKEKDIPRTYSEGAEGTPSFRTIDWSQSPPTAEIYFHYWRNMDVDRQASATLDSDWNWKPTKNPLWDERAEMFGVKGNIGDRDHFRLDNVDYVLLEGMKSKGDWSSWSVYLLKPNIWTVPTQKLEFVTPKKSTSFANPTLTLINHPKLGKSALVTLFLPSQGNAPDESGQLLYVVPIDASNQLQ